jgi:hypothetical protein
MFIEVKNSSVALGITANGWPKNSNRLRGTSLKNRNKV